jgi:hypothetical protein
MLDFEESYSEHKKLQPYHTDSKVVSTVYFHSIPHYPCLLSF